MSTGGGQTKSTELLVALGINDEISKKNITTYIKNLKSIPNLTINLEVKGQNTQIFNEYAKQIKALEQQLEAFNLKLKSVGSVTSPSLSFFDDFKQQVTRSVKSVDTLNKAFGDVKINVNSFYKQLAKVPTGDLQSLEKFVSQLKSEIEKVATNQFKLVGVQETQQNLQALETNLYNIYELQKAYADTTSFEQLISQITELNTQITNIQLGEGINIAGISEIPSQLEKINQGIIEFGNNTKTTAQNSTNFLTSFIDGATRAFEITELVKNKTAEINPPKTAEKNSEKASAKIDAETPSNKVGGIAAVGSLASIGRGLLASTGVGAALVVAEWGINKLQEHSAKIKQMAEELEAEQKNIVNSYVAHAPDIESLSSKFAELEKSIALGNTDPSVLTEYQDISNQLGEFLPHIVTREDEIGNKIIGSSEALKVKIELLKEQQALEAQIAEQAAQEKRDKDIKTRKKSISELEDNQTDIAKKLHHKASIIPDDITFLENGKPLLKTTEDYKNKIKEIKKLQSSAIQDENYELAEYYQNLSDAVKQCLEEISDNENKLNQDISAQKSDYISNIAHVISENDKLNESLKTNAEGFAAQLIAATDFSDLDNLQESLTSLFSNEDANTVINNIIGSFQNMENATSETFDSMANTAKSQMENISGDLSKLGLSEKEVNSIMASLKQRYEDTTQKQKDLSLEMKVNNLTFAEAKEKVEGYKGEVEKLTTSYEQLAGVSQKKVNDTSELLFQYEMLTNQLKGYTEEEIRNYSQKSDLTAEEQRLVDILNSRDLVMNSLNKIYPSLLDQDGQAISLSAEKIKAIQAENHANETLLKAYQLARQGKLSIQQQSVVDEASFTKATIENIKKNIQALSILQAKLQEVYNEQVNNMKNDDPNSYTYGYGAYRSGTLIGQAQTKISDYSSQLNELQKSLDADISTIDSFNISLNNTTKTTKNNTSTTKNNNSTTKNSIYITDKYKQKLEELNLEIEKQQKLQSKFPEHSAEYRRALEKQIKFEKEKLKVMQGQEASLQKQIASGKIQLTGNISSKSSSTTTTSNQKLSGWKAPKTSGFGSSTVGGPHRGIDLASPKGTRLDANVSGKVIASGNATSFNMSKTYGNVVVIQDENGLKHIYAHLEKAIAQLDSTVSAGTQIGTIGNSGRVKSKTGDGSHLHYEINKNGKPIDPSSYIKNAQNGKVTITSTSSSGSSSTVDSTQQAIDQAKSELAALQQQILAQIEVVENKQREIIDSYLSGFERKKTNIDNLIEASDNKLKTLTVSSESYRKELDKQTSALNNKKKVNQNEITYLEGVIKSGTVSAKVVDEYTQRLHELKMANSEIDFAIWDVGTQKLESYMSKFDEQRQTQENTIAYEKAKLEELDTSSARYVKTLANINNAMREKQISNRAELTQLTTIVNGNKLFGDGLESAKKRIEELNIEVKELQIDIQNGDYDILVNIKTQSDKKVSDIDYDINQAELIRKMFDEGSVDYGKYTDVMIDGAEKLAKQHLETRDALYEELKQRDITAQRVEQVTKMIQDEQTAYVNATVAIKAYTKQMEDAKESKLKDIAEKAINAYKEYVQERRDEHIKMLDDEIKRENEKHELVIKQLNDEMDLFKKNVQEKLKLIDRQEAERDYNMQIDDLEKERDKLQAEYNLLLLDNSNEAKQKRKKLQEQLDKIDKEIIEKRHGRDIELQKQGLNDLLENKEDEINGKIELQDKEHENIINKINREKEYWEKHYKDLLNDERKFTEIRDAILSGHFENVDAEFKKFADEMRATMPQLADTLDGTMEAVGTSIRNNVIHSLEEALNLMEQFNNQVSKDDGSLNFDMNTGNGEGAETSKGNLSKGDLQVLLGKFLFDNVSPYASGSDKDSIRETANKLAEQGRANGSTQFTRDDVSFNQSIKGLTLADMDSLYEYFNSKKGFLGGKYDSFIEQFISTISGSKHEATNPSTLSKEDMKVMLGKFIYEKLVPDRSLSANTKTALKSKADGIAAQGRSNGSKISENVTFDSIKSTYTTEQISQLKSFFESNLGIIDNATTRELMRQKIASLDTGGFMNWAGIGIDGKGGKAIIAHPNEIMLNKADTKGFFDSIDVMDKVMSSIKPILANFTLQPTLANYKTSGDVFQIQFGDIIESTKEQADTFGKTIVNRIKREKGGKW